MTGPERDVLILGFGLGLVLGGSFGMWLGCRAGSWAARRTNRLGNSARKAYAADTVTGLKQASTPQDVRVVLKRPQAIPLVRRRDPEKMPVRRPQLHAIPIIRDLNNRCIADLGMAGLTEPEAKALVKEWRAAWPGASEYNDDTARANATAQMIRKDALAALTGAGYKRAAADAALDACTLVERAGGLESWVAAALRRAAMGKP